MTNESWYPAPVCPAVSVALEKRGPIPHWVWPAGQFPAHYCPGLSETSARFTGVPALDWQGCVGPEVALWSYSGHCANATATTLKARFASRRCGH